MTKSVTCSSVVEKGATPYRYTKYELRYMIQSMEIWILNNPGHSDVPRVREAMFELRKQLNAVS